MKFLVDTDTCSFAIRGNGRVLTALTQKYSLWAISSITEFELRLGAAVNPAFGLAVEAFLVDATVLQFDSPSAQAAAVIGANLRAKGTPLDTADLLIAGHAAAYDLTLVTNNTKHFARVTRLKLANWS